MVSYGDSGFHEWAEENGFDDTDVRLMQRTAGKRALMWFCIPWAFARIAVNSGTGQLDRGGGHAVCGVLQSVFCAGMDLL